MTWVGSVWSFSGWCKIWGHLLMAFNFNPKEFIVHEGVIHPLPT